MNVEALLEHEIKTPCYVVDESALIKNLEILKDVQEKSGAKILLALKGFAMWHFFPLIGRYLSGTAASGLFEARLGAEEMGLEVHSYSPAFKDSEFPEILKYSHHVVFNSPAQWRHFQKQALGSKGKHFGIRVNPEHSEVKTAIYDPCAPGSRLGTIEADFDLSESDWQGLSGLHFHNLCELGADALERTLKTVEKKFNKHFHRLSWINFGGGHHITRADYDREALIQLIRNFKSRYHLEVYLEPGEAIALNTGVLVTTVLDTLHNHMPLAIMDASAAAHMPDVIEMPYRPEIFGAGKPEEKQHNYRLGGPSCLAGDVIGDYSFDKPLVPGAKLAFGDMAHYSMVKNNTFNGIPLPSIYGYNSDKNKLWLVKEFSYDDFKARLS
ncbi:MAG: carboxynorspermidine decarboxylase [Spirochaetales bacterium]|nr:carboxynorspermidine decarboxylase [Spirochaetales bacterium]